MTTTNGERIRLCRDRKRRGVLVLPPIEVDATLPQRLAAAGWMKKSETTDPRAVWAAIVKAAKHELKRRAAKGITGPLRD